MDNVTMYAHQLSFDEVKAIVEKQFPKGKMEYVDNGKNKSLKLVVKGGFFSKSINLTINYRERKRPDYKLDQVECGLTQNLAGMVNYIQSLPAKNEAVRNKFAVQVMAANCEMPFMVEPGFTPELVQLLEKLLLALDAFVYINPNQVLNESMTQYFADKNLNLILDTEGNCNVEDIVVHVDAKYKDAPKADYKSDQIRRKERSEDVLHQYKIKVNKHLPCIESEETVRIRSQADIIERAFALMTLAAKGEGVAKSSIDNVMAEKNVNGYSPKESELMALSELTDEQRAYATWRYESLQVLLWILGIIDHLKFPTAICDVSSLVGAMLKPDRKTFESSVALKSKTEILDELDKTYRMSWACVDARLKGVEVAKVHPDIIYERHHVLNWVTFYEDLDWDDVRTDT